MVLSTSSSVHSGISFVSGLDSIVLSGVDTVWLESDVQKSACIFRILLCLMQFLQIFTHAQFHLFIAVSDPFVLLMFSALAPYSSLLFPSFLFQ